MEYILIRALFACLLLPFVQSHTNHDTALIAALDGTIHLVNRDSGRIIWSFQSGSPIYSSYQAPINNYVDCGDDWMLFTHTDRGKENMDMSLKEYIESLPRGSFHGQVLVGVEKNVKFVVDANTGRLIRVHHTSSSKENWDSIIRNAKLEISDVVGQQLSFTRTDYLLQSFTANSENVLWNLTVAEIDVALLCEENPNSPSPSLSKSSGNFNMPLFCRRKAAVQRLRSPYIFDSFSEAEHKVIADDTLPPNSDMTRESYLPVPLWTLILVVLIFVCFLVYPNHNSETSSTLNLKLLGECDDTKGRLINQRIFVSSTQIATGSDGTVVWEGKYAAHQVAVKRLVKAHHDVAFKEMKTLVYTDKHPNIVRFYAVEEDDDFIYVALERCTCSLSNLVETDENDYMWRSYDHPSPILVKLMREVVCGLVHLHELRFIHRDLRPHNVLIIKDTETSSLCVKLSDMGISRRLEANKSSLGSNATSSGRSGWKAPEQLQEIMESTGRRESHTRAMDLFSLGCVLFFCITRGKHPFGDSDEVRDANVLNNEADLSLVKHIAEAIDLIPHLLSHDAKFRPNASVVLHHPLFWDSAKRLEFVRELSDWVEPEDRSSIITYTLQSKALEVFGRKWDKKMGRDFIAEINRHRFYNYKSFKDLLRLMRNTLNHYGEQPNNIQELWGSVPEGFDMYFRRRFPKLLMEVYDVAYDYCKEEEWFKRYLKD